MLKRNEISRPQIGRENKKITLNNSTNAHTHQK